jgi:hypothetical protein
MTVGFFILAFVECLFMGTALVLFLLDVITAYGS